MRRLVLEVLVLLGLLVAACAYVTQPVLPRGGTTVQQGADPLRLQGHVRVLSERFSPRGEKNLKNLNAAAEYIADTLRAAGGALGSRADRIPAPVRRVLSREGRASFDPLT